MMSLLGYSFWKELEERLHPDYTKKLGWATFRLSIQRDCANGLFKKIGCLKDSFSLITKKIAVIWKLQTSILRLYL